MQTGLVVTVPQKVKEGAPAAPPPEAPGTICGLLIIFFLFFFAFFFPGMLFSGLSVKDPEEIAAPAPPAAPPSLLGQGGDLLEDVELELPVRKPQAAASVNIMDLDAMSTLPAPGDEKKKGKKKHKKEHKEHRSKKSSSSSSAASSSVPAAGASAPAAGADAAKAVVRKRVQRGNVTRPGYGREEDHSVPMDDTNVTDTEVKHNSSPHLLWSN